MKTEISIYQDYLTDTIDQMVDDPASDDIIIGVLVAERHRVCMALCANYPYDISPAAREID